MKQTLIDWLGTFWKVIVSPSSKTFLKESKKANGKFPSALGWLVSCAIYIVIIVSIASQSVVSVLALLTAIILLPLAVVLFTSVLNFICQRAFRQKAYIYDQLLYMVVAILLPIFICVPLLMLSSLDAFRVLSFILIFYQIMLLMIAVKAIAKIEFWQALFTVTVSVIVGILIGFVIFMLIVSTLSPIGIKQN